MTPQKKRCYSQEEDEYKYSLTIIWVIPRIGISSSNFIKYDQEELWVISFTWINGKHDSMWWAPGISICRHSR